MMLRLHYNILLLIKPVKAATLSETSRPRHRQSPSLTHLLHTEKRSFSLTHFFLKIILNTHLRISCTEKKRSFSGSSELFNQSKSIVILKHFLGNSPHSNRNDVQVFPLEIVGPYWVSVNLALYWESWSLPFMFVLFFIFSFTFVFVFVFVIEYVLVNLA